VAGISDPLDHAASPFETLCSAAGSMQSRKPPRHRHKLVRLLIHVIIGCTAKRLSAVLWRRSGQPAVALFVNVDQLGWRLSRFTLRDALVCRFSVAVTASL
jgi:hypothetical protein